MKTKKRNVACKRPCLVGGTISLIIVALALLLLPGPVLSAQDSWTGGATGYWTDSTWQSAPPGSTSDVVINRSGGATITLNTNPTINSLTLGTNASNILQWANGGYRLTINNGLTINSGSSVTLTDNDAYLALAGGTSTNSGIIYINGSNEYMQVSSGALFTNNGTLNVVGNGAFATLKIFDNLTNNGTINITNSLARLSFDSSPTKSHTLDGTGFVVLAGGAITTATTGNSLTIGSNATVKGTGIVGNTQLNLVNNGTIEATTGTITVNPASSFQNNGTVKADATRTLTINALSNLSSGTLTGGAYYAAGTINVPGFITTNAANITLDATGGGAAIINTGGSNALAGLTTNSGTLTLLGGKSFTITTTTLTLANSGTISGNGYISSSGTDLGITNQGAGTIKASGGTLTITSKGTGVFRNQGTARADNDATLTIAGNNLHSSTYASNQLLEGTWYAAGTINLPGTGSITANAANITLDGAGASTINMNSTNALSALASNSGSFTLTGNKAFTTSASTLANSGTMSIGAGSSLTLSSVSGTYNQSSGTTTVSGTVSAPNITIGGGTFALNSGGSLTGTPNVALSGTGTFNQAGGTANIGTFDYNDGTLTKTGGTGSITTFNYKKSGGTAFPADLSQFAVTNFTQMAGSLTFSPLTLQTTPGAGAYKQYNLQTGGTFNGDVSLSGTGAFNQAGGTANIGTFDYNDGTLTKTSGSGSITTFNYKKSGGTTFPADLSQFAVTNFNQSAGSLTFSPLTLQTTPGSGAYKQYNLQAGGTLNGDVSVNTGGIFNQAGGTLNANVTQSGGTVTGTLVVPSGKTFTYNSGTFSGNLVSSGTATFANGATIPSVTINGGTVEPGKAGAVGTLNVTNNYTQSAGALNIELLNLSSFDFLNITGTANFTGGTLNVALLPGYSFPTTKSFPIITATGGITGSFANVVLPLGYTLSLSADHKSEILTTPIPASVWMLAAGLIGLIGVRRRITHKTRA